MRAASNKPPWELVLATLIPESLVEFLEGGVSILVGCSDGAGRPECVRGVGALVAPSRGAMTVYLAQVTAGRSIEYVAAHPQLAVGFSRAVDHRSIQVKGRVVGSRPAHDAEKAIVDQYVVAFAEAVHLVGMARCTTRRLCVWPAHALELQVGSVYEQTPGPQAGAPYTR